MPRSFLLAAALTATLYLGSPLSAAPEALISEETAAQHGLTRPWFTQVEFDRGRSRLRDLVLCDGVLYAQTDRSIIHAIDAETGKTLWRKQVGNPDLLSFAPDANRDLLAVVNGSRLYVLDRHNGEILNEQLLKGAPGAGPALSAKRVYVPTNTGMVFAFRLATPNNSAHPSAKSGKDAEPAEKPTAGAKRGLSLDPPLVCQSFGHALVQPLVTRENSGEELVVWPTDRGCLNLGHIDRRADDHLTLKYRVETGAAIVGRPSYLPADPKVARDSGLIIVVSCDGLVQGVRETDGSNAWRFSTGEPITIAPAVIDNRVYVSTQLGGMHCLAAKTGKELWFAPDILQFVAASKARAYATDRIGRLVVLNVEDGARLDVVATESTPIKLLNTNTDRIYLADDAGLVECIHEAELGEPIVHRRHTAEAEEKPVVKKKHGAAEHASPPPGATHKDGAAPQKKKVTKKESATETDDQDSSNPFGEDASGADNDGNDAKSGKIKKAKAAADGF